MKKIGLLLLFTGALCGSMGAQNGFQLTRHAESKKIDTPLLEKGIYVGQYEGLYCWIGDGRRHRKHVVLADHNLEPLRRMELPESAVNYRILTASMHDNHATVLLVDEPDNRHTLVYKAVVDLDSMRPAEGTQPLTVVDSFSYDRKDHCLVWAATSPNGTYTALITIVEYTAKKQYSARAVLMNNDLSTVWTKDYAMGSMDQLVVTDDGTMVTLGHELAYPETHIIFNVMSEKRADSYEVTVTCDPIRQLRLAGVVGRHAMAVGTFTPNGKNPEGDICGGTLGLSFDIDSAVMTGFVMRPFQNEDLNLLYNKKTKKVQRLQEVEMVSVIDAVPTTFGAVLAVGRNYMEAEVENNGTTTNIYHRQGIHLMAMDTLGRVTYVRNLRRNDRQKSENDLLNVSLLSRYGKVYVLKSESRDYPATYDIAKEAKQYTAGSKSNLVVYAIDPNGDVQKTMVEQKTPHTLMRCVWRPDDTIVALTVDGSRKRLAELKIR